MVQKHPLRWILLVAVCLSWTLREAEASGPGRDLLQLIALLNGPQHAPRPDRATQAATLQTRLTEDPMTEYIVQRHNGLQGTTDKVLANLVLVNQQAPQNFSDFNEAWQHLKDLREGLFEIVQFYKADPEDALRRLNVQHIINAHTYWGVLEMTGFFCNFGLGRLLPTTKLSDPMLSLIRGHLEDASNLIQAHAPDHALRFLVTRKIAETWARQAQHYHTLEDKRFGLEERSRARDILIPLLKEAQLPEEDRAWARLWDAKVVSISATPEQQKKGRARLRQLLEEPLILPRVKEAAARSLERLCRLKDGRYDQAYYWDKRVAKLVGQHSEPNLLTLIQGIHDLNRTEYIRRIARQNPSFRPESVHDNLVKAATFKVAKKVMEDPLADYASPAWVFETIEAYTGPLDPPLGFASSSASLIPDFALPTPYLLDQPPAGEREAFFTAEERHTIRNAVWKIGHDAPLFSSDSSGAEEPIYVIDVLSRLWIRALKNPDAIPLFFRGLLESWDECPSGDVTQLLNLMHLHFPEFHVASPRVAILHSVQTQWQAYLYNKYHRELRYQRPRELRTATELQHHEDFLKAAWGRFSTKTPAESEVFMGDFRIFAENEINRLLAQHDEPPLTEAEKTQYVHFTF